MAEDDYQHEGLCNLCGIVCFWQDCPTGGWWIHDWPSPDVEAHFKDPHQDLRHDADPGWKPLEEITDDGELVTTEERE